MPPEIPSARRGPTALLCVFVVAVHLGQVAQGAAAAESSSPTYLPPVAAAVIEEFRLPTEKWMAGNRGIDYGTAPGTAVRAAASGTVSFAGAVGGARHVVVLHPDGIRTTYAFLRSVAVVRGDSVEQGQLLGTTAGALHFGARVGDDYIDPLGLFGAPPPRVHLVPDATPAVATEDEERRGLLKALAGAASRMASGATAMAGWAGDRAGDLSRAVRWLARETGSRAMAAVDDRLAELGGLAQLAQELDPSTHLRRLAATAVRWWRQRGNCTPESLDPPGPDGERRIAVMVSGLGSNSASDSLDRLDTTSLGFRPTDVVRFSYRGGEVGENPYTAADTTADLRESARLLRDLLVEVAADHPGVPVDLIAHSQGGIVARQMLAFELGDEVRPLPEVARLVTLGTPHGGADLATALTMLDQTVTGRVALALAHRLAPGAVPRGPAIAQLAESSEFMHRLSDADIPVDVEVTSIAARGDLTVPAVRSQLDGADNVVVSVEGVWGDHSSLPGSPQARREVALALAGLPPTCQGLVDMLVDTATADAIATTQDGLGMAAWAGASAADSRGLRALRSR